MKLKAKIAGRKVHDVGYRVFMLDRAQELRLRGFEAQNRKENGGQLVLVFMEGDEHQIAELKGFIEKETPPDAEVSSIVFEDYPGLVMDINSFHQRTNTQQLNNGINALLRIDKKQDVMIGKQDIIIAVLEEVKEDTSDIRNDISALRKDASETLYEKYEQLSREIAEIKTTLSEIKAKAA
jgi:acylphosphatase